MWNTTIGHTNQKKQFVASLKSGKLHHALLFSGIPGIGKTQMAEGLAMLLNCLESKEAPCGICLSCKKIQNRVHPDIYRIEPEEEKEAIAIAPLRDLQSKLHFHPLEGEAKCVLIEPAHAMTLAAANALLKILEEPPQNTYFFLISDQPYRLPATIRSRCQQWGFSPIPDSLLKNFLAKTKGEENLDKIVRLAQGSVTRALEWNKDFAESIFQDILQLWKSPTPSQILETAEKWSKEEETPKMIALLAGLWRDAFLAPLGAGEEKMLFPETKMIREHLVKLGSKTLENHWQHLLQSLKDLERYANKQLLWENLLFQLTQTV